MVKYQISTINFEFKSDRDEQWLSQDILHAQACEDEYPQVIAEFNTFEDAEKRFNEEYTTLNPAYIQATNCGYVVLGEILRLEKIIYGKYGEPIEWQIIKEKAKGNK